MRFRTKHIADSVIERIQALMRGEDPPEHLEAIRGPEGMAPGAADAPPPGLILIGEGQSESPSLGEAGPVVSTVLGGGDAIDSLLSPQTSREL